LIRHYFQLAVRSLRRNVALTVLAIGAIGVGIGASMSMLTILRAAAGDPIPQKSATLFTPQLDNFGPQRGVDRLPQALTYIDAEALMQAHAASQQGAMYPTALTVTEPGAARIPIQGQALATSSDFFPMFDVPFEYGGPWSQTEDDAHTPVVVLSRPFNDQLFGGANSVGRSITIDGGLYRVIGVMSTWRPSPRFYDLGSYSYSGEDQLFLPFTRAIDEHMETSGNITCIGGAGPGRSWSSLLASNCTWIHLWVALPTSLDVANYRMFLHNYAAQQRRQGRFNWPPHVALLDVMQWLAYSRIVPVAVSTLTDVSFAILLVCLLNATGLMFVKFMGNTAAVAVRRALGATRQAIFEQCLVEAGVIGLTGGLVGIALTKLGLISCRSVLTQDLSVLTRLRGGDVTIALGAAIVATLLAGLYPTWRATQVQPAAHLKTQ
jgi:putative ABC transport system permease protein